MTKIDNLPFSKRMDSLKMEQEHYSDSEESDGEE